MEENKEQKKKKPGFFRTLFRGLNTLRLIILNIVFFIFFYAFITVLGALPAQKKQAVTVTNDSVLCINPVGIAAESENEDFSISINYLKKEKIILIPELTKAIRNAAFDRRVKSLFMDFSALDGISSGHIAELASALEEFKKSGKEIFAYSTHYTIPTYYLASYANRIGLDPFGDISFVGFASQAIFKKKMEEKFGIRWNVLQAGDYKGMAESYSRTELSENVRSNLQSLFDDLWNKYAQNVAANRKISLEKLNNFAVNNGDFIKKYSGDIVKAALKENLITDIASVDEFSAKIGLADPQSYKITVNTISYYDYNTNYKVLDSMNRIALIHLEGAITSSTARQSGIASAPKIVNLFDIAMNDPTVKAIVLRVDSGGGEVFASEEIRRAVDRAKRKGLPVIVSMGSVAASGAYWISSSSDYIFASPYTITGSIGVLGTMPTFQTGLEEHLGITADLVYAGQKPSHSIFKNPSEEDKELRRLEIMKIYKDFIQVVSTGRKISFEKVADLAGGRVYSAEQALKLKLVDKIGSLNDATKYAAKVAKIENNFSIKEVKKALSPAEEVLKGFVEGLDESAIIDMPLSELKTLFEFSHLNQEKGIYVYTPERLIWE